MTGTVETFTMSQSSARLADGDPQGMADALAPQLIEADHRRKDRQARCVGRRPALGPDLVRFEVEDRGWRVAIRHLRDARTVAGLAQALPQRLGLRDLSGWIGRRSLT